MDDSNNYTLALKKDPVHTGGLVITETLKKILW